jgi:hypothetical protein
LTAIETRHQTNTSNDFTLKIVIEVSLEDHSRSREARL